MLDRNPHTHTLNYSLILTFYSETGRPGIFNPPVSAFQVVGITSPQYQAQQVIAMLFCTAKVVWSIPNCPPRSFIFPDVEPMFTE